MRDTASIVLDFCALQKKLVCRLIEEFGALDGWDLDRLPRAGSLRLGEESWSFRRHGAGVCFSLGAEVVDAHWAPERIPDGVDAWRLTQYLEGLGIYRISLDGVEYAATDETEVHRLLVRLAQRGVLAMPRDRDVFRPS